MAFSFSELCRVFLFSVSSCLFHFQVPCPVLGTVLLSSFSSSGPLLRCVRPYRACKTSGPGEVHTGGRASPPQRTEHNRNWNRPPVPPALAPGQGEDRTTIFVLMCSSAGVPACLPVSPPSPSSLSLSVYVCVAPVLCSVFCIRRSPAVWTPSVAEYGLVALQFLAGPVSTEKCT